MLLFLCACPNTTSKVGGSTASDDEVGEPPAEGDVVADHRTFFIAESVKFDGGGDCENKELNTVTNTLHNRLLNAGWAGLRFVDDDTWPEDFREGSASVSHLDDIYADAARVTVYAGHGGIDRLQWGRPSPDGECLTDLDDVRLGTLAGDKAAATLLMTSCTMRVDQAWPVLQSNACRQFFGYHNSPHIGYDEARKVFKRTHDGQATVDAWLEEMVHNAFGHNSPVALTLGVDADDAKDMHGMTNLATGEGYMQNVGEPIDGYFYEWFDNGCTGLCGQCDEDSPLPPQMTLPVSAPRLKLTRPVRSSAQLQALALALLARFDIQPLSAPEQARLATWTSSIVASGDIVHARLLDEPRIDLTYDPSSDELRITDRSALDQARPQPGEVGDDDPELEAALRSEAEQILDDIPVAMLDRLAGEFEVTRREVGFGNAMDPPTPSIAYEVLFTLPGRVDELTLVGRSLTLGVTRLGELSTIVASSVDVEIVGEARLLQTPQQALDRLSAAIHAEHPNVVEIEFVEPEVGYALAEAESGVEVVPSLLVSYVLAFGTGESRVISRRFPVRISLVTPHASMAPIESLLAQDPNPQVSDARDSR